MFGGNKNEMQIKREKEGLTEDIIEDITKDLQKSKKKLICVFLHKQRTK